MRVVDRAFCALSWVACAAAFAGAAASPAADSGLPAPRLVHSTSSYSLQFLRPVPDGEGLLWSEVEVSTAKGGSRVLRTAPAPVAGNSFAAFSWQGGDDEVERGELWSPDGHFAALHEFACTWTPGTASPVICHLHQTILVDLDRPDDARCGLVLGRYNFSGWAADKPHSALYSPALDGEIREADLGSCPPGDLQIQPPAPP